MRLYPRQGQTAIDHPEHGHFDVGDHGGFDLPDDLSDRLHRFHVGGRPLWETDIERQQRLVNEELERRRDPQTLLAAVEQIMRAAQATTTVAEAAEAEKASSADATDAEPAKTPVKRARKAASSGE